MYRNKCRSCARLLTLAFFHQNCYFNEAQRSNLIVLKRFMVVSPFANSLVPYEFYASIKNLRCVKLFIDEVLFLLTGNAGEVCCQPLTL